MLRHWQKSKVAQHTGTCISVATFDFLLKLNIADKTGVIKTVFLMRFAHQL